MSKPVKSKVAVKESLLGNDVCICLHTALRKCCNSKITTAAYNVIDIVCELGLKPHKYDPWRFYGQMIADRVNAGEKGLEASRQSASELNDKFTDMLIETRAEKEEPDNCRQALYALTSIFACFNDSDWEGFTAYL